MGVASERVGVSGLCLAQDMHCVVLVEKELSPFIRVSLRGTERQRAHTSCSSPQVYLSPPIWSSRITILIGSPMKKTDLARARIDTATACFIHTSRSGQDPETAVSWETEKLSNSLSLSAVFIPLQDQHTVISAWSVKNFAPHCKLYVHILRPETRMHLDLADQVHTFCGTPSTSLPPSLPPSRSPSLSLAAGDV